jgi:hypothetical protein
MNLNNLKPAWRQFVLFNSIQPIDQDEILFIIERAEQQTRRLPKFLTSTMMIIILTVCCQGG